MALVSNYLPTIDNWAYSRFLAQPLFLADISSLGPI